ncbi:hypothetical protein J3A78_005213 [Streptomyces sp. PvR006]|uniref:hypothetical protein n=1 Tax=Streptomyces sp. PvR006 TaxID=2817860 RepID=UPI001AE0F41E|nr:hypothetical protein [Streptomyces sp. PvR006]MBP2584735.1 hypothetical protein [Streptomyces sp. PvR006]
MTTDLNSVLHRHEIPEDGLEEVLRGWSSKAQLYNALAGVADDWAEVKWSSLEIQQRAHRVLYAKVVELLNGWPRKTTDWTDALPAGSRRTRRVSSNPDPGTDWVASAVRRGWPADEFVVNERARVPDQVMAASLSWTIDQIAKIQKDALKVERESLKNAAKQELATLFEVRKKPPLETSTGIRPTRQDIIALRRSGAPWTHLAGVAELLADADKPDLMEFARRHLLPDDDVRWRLFHLGTLGVLLRSLRDGGWKLANLRPLSGSKKGGPNYVAESPDGQTWDIWFEASRIWDYYNVPSPYIHLMEGVFASDADPVGADLAIIQKGVAAYLFECKYGGAGEVRRKGYHQVTTYVTEALEQLVPKAQGVVVGPDDVVLKSAEVVLDGSPIRVVGPRHLRGFLPGS